MITRNTKDGRNVVALSQAPDGWNTFLTGRSDNPGAVFPESKSGTGGEIKVSFSGPGNSSVDIVLADPVYLHNGQVYVSGSWDLTDSFSLVMVIPATSFDEGGNKDVMSVPIGPGIFAWKYVEPGSGTHHFDQVKAIPVPTPKPELGWWNIDLSNSDVFPVENVAADWALLSFQVEAHFLKSIPVGSRGFATEMYQSEWISQKWKLRWDVSKISEGVGTATAWLFTFRQNR